MIREGSEGERFRRELLDAAREHKPSPALTARLHAMADALSPTQTPRRFTTSTALKCVGLLALSAAFLRGGSRSAPEPPTPAPVVASPIVAPPPSRDSIDVNDLPATAQTAETPTPTRAAPSAKAPAKTLAPEEPPVRAPTTSAAQLGEETRRLTEIRAAIRTSHPREALTLLEEYRSLFPAGILTDEALLLRVQVLFDLGHDHAARSLATRFIESHPSSPYAEPLRELLAARPTTDE